MAKNNYFIWVDDLRNWVQISKSVFDSIIKSNITDIRKETEKIYKGVETHYYINNKRLLLKEHTEI